MQKLTAWGLKTLIVRKIDNLLKKSTEIVAGSKPKVDSHNTDTIPAQTDVNVDEEMAGGTKPIGVEIKSGRKGQKRNQKSLRAFAARLLRESKVLNTKNAFSAVQNRSKKAVGKTDANVTATMPFSPGSNTEPLSDASSENGYGQGVAAVGTELKAQH